MEDTPDGDSQPRVRLVGVKCENLRDAQGTPEQLVLDLGRDESSGPDRDRARADAAVDRARSRFGPDAVTSASLVRRADEPDRPLVSSADRYRPREPQRSDSPEP